MSSNSNERGSSNERGRVITVASGKGGVGKTTVAVQLAATAHMMISKARGREVRTALVDNDWSRNASAALQVPEVPVEQSVAQVYMSAQKHGSTPTPVTEFMLPVRRKEVIGRREVVLDEGIDIAPGHDDLEDVNVTHVAKADRWELLRKAMTTVRQQYPLTVIDSHPDNSLVTANALGAADGILIVVQVSYLGVQGLRKELNKMMDIRSTVRVNIPIIGVLPTFVNASRKISRQVMDYLTEGELYEQYPDLKGKVMDNRVSFREIYTKIQLQGTSIWCAYPSEDLSLKPEEIKSAREEWLKVAEEVMQRCRF